MLVLLITGCMGGGDEEKERPPRPIHLVGRVVGSSYISLHGDFTVPFPVRPELHGRITYDDPQSVTFYDNWGDRISFFSKPMTPGSPMAEVLRAQGPQKALDVLLKDIYGSDIVNHYHPDVLNGTTSFIYLRPVGPKTGVAAFVHRERVYLVETDLMPGLTVVGGSDDASLRAQEESLENSAITLLRSMQVK